MTIFARKSVSPTEFDTIQNVIGHLQMRLGAYDVMMLSTMPTKSSKCEVYIGLPDARLLAPFPGFRPVDRASIPSGLISLVARDDGFAQSFPDIARKIGRRT
jgi:hypothetical protein